MRSDDCALHSSRHSQEYRAEVPTAPSFVAPRGWKVCADIGEWHGAVHRAASKFQNKIPPDKCDGLLMWVFPREKFRRAPKLELNAALEIGQQHGDFWRLYQPSEMLTHPASQPQFIGTSNYLKSRHNLVPTLRGVQSSKSQGLRELVLDHSRGWIPPPAASSTRAAEPPYRQPATRLAAM